MLHFVQDDRRCVQVQEASGVGHSHLSDIGCFQGHVPVGRAKDAPEESGLAGLARPRESNRWELASGPLQDGLQRSLDVDRQGDPQRANLLSVCHTAHESSISPGSVLPRFASGSKIVYHKLLHLAAGRLAVRAHASPAHSHRVSYARAAHCGSQATDQSATAAGGEGG